jgi:hypothetical protein
MEVYKNIPGNTLSSLTTNPKYPSKPDVTTKIKKLKAPQNAGDLYGVRLTAYYVVSCLLYQKLCRNLTRCKNYILQIQRLCIPTSCTLDFVMLLCAHPCILCFRSSLKIFFINFTIK